MQLEGIDHVASACAMLSAQRSGTSRFSGSSDFTKAFGTACQLLLVKETPESRCSRRATEPKPSNRREIRMLHLAFRANRENFLAAQRELEKRGIEFEFQDHEIAHSIYFRDPDGHQLEITTYDLPQSL